MDRFFVALIGEPLCERLAEPLHWPPCVVAVIAIDPPGQQHPHDMVEIVVPLRLVVDGLPVGIARQPPRIVIVVLERQMDMPTRRGRPHTLGDLIEDVLAGIVEHGLHRIETQAVEVEFLNPVERILDEIGPHGRLGEVDRAAPGRLVAPGEELRRVVLDCVLGRTEMVIDDVQHHRDPGPRAPRRRVA